MEQRNFRDTGDMISLLGFGCMRLPKIDPDKSDIDFDKAAEMIDYAYKNGVNYFDTAYPYHEGKSELFVGEVMKKYPRESFHLASKLPVWLVEKPEDTEKYLNEQLQKCQVEYFDFYLCHALNRERLEIIRKNGIHEQLLKSKKEGKIRNLGFSFHGDFDTFEELLNEFKWDFVQIQLNYYDWKLQDAKRAYEMITSRGLQVVVMEPVRGGALHTLCKEAVDIFKKADPNASVASWAVRYAASLPKVMTVLSGMTTMEQVKDNVATMVDFKPLTDGDRETIAQAVEAYSKSKTVPCTGCRYCMDCPSGVDIPLVFKVYNEYATTENKAKFLEQYDAMSDEKQAHNCVYCKACVSLCPQSIEIPEKLAGVEALVKKLRG